MPDDVLSRIQRKRVSVPPRDLSLVPLPSDRQPLEQQPVTPSLSPGVVPTDQSSINQTIPSIASSSTLDLPDLSVYEMDLAGVSLRLQRDTYETLKQLCKGSVTINNSTLIEAVIDYLANPDHKDLLERILQDADQRGRVRSLAGERKKLQTRSIKLGL